MATGIAKNLSILAVEAESTEGTYVAPAGATSYYEPLSDGFEIVPAREKLDRNVLSSSVGKVTPRLGIRSVTAQAPVEFRASGTEGAAPNFGLFVKGALGATRSIASTTTTKSSGNTGSQLQIEDADISKFNVYDIVVVKESGLHWPCVITAKDSSSGAANITISPAKPSGSFSDSVVISKSTMYYPANTGHPALSLSNYLANEIRQSAYGCKVVSMSLENFQTGQLASLNFGLEGMGYGEVNGAAPHTPTYDSGIPPVILSAYVYRDGVATPLNAFALNLQNTLAWMTATQNENGRQGSRVVERVITGTMNPYKDDTSVANHTAFDAGTEFALFVKAFVPTSTAGEMVMGSVIGIYLPKCMATGTRPGDVEGVLTDDIEFQANRGADGDTGEMYVGFI